MYRASLVLLTVLIGCGGPGHGPDTIALDELDRESGEVDGTESATIDESTARFVALTDPVFEHCYEVDGRHLPPSVAETRRHRVARVAHHRRSMGAAWSGVSMRFADAHRDAESLPAASVDPATATLSPLEQRIVALEAELDAVHAAHADDPDWSDEALSELEDTARLLVELCDEADGRI